MADPRRCFVTGARGLLGREIVRELRAHDDRPLVLATRSGLDLPAQASPYVETFHMDLEAPRLPDNIDTVIHAAGEKTDTALMETVNHHGAQTLARLAARHGVRRFIHISSVGVYGASPRTTSIDENSSQFPRNAYERSKALGDASVRKLAQETGMEIIVLRPSTVLAAMPGVHYPLLGLARAITSRRFRWLCGHAPMSNYIGVRDVASAVAFCAISDRTTDQSYIVNTPTPMRNVTHWISEVLGVSPPVKCLPELPVRVAGWCSDVFERLRGQTVAMTPYRLHELTCRTRFEPELLLAKGFEYPVGIEATVRQLMAGYQQEGLI